MGIQAFSALPRILFPVTVLWLWPFTLYSASATKLPDEIYFSLGWCPGSEDLSEISKYLSLTMNGCCISKGAPTPEAIANPDALKKWGHHTSPNYYPRARCNGRTFSAEEELEQSREYQEQTERRENERRAEQHRREKEAPKVLRQLSKIDFCVTLGKSLRGEELDELGGSSALPTLVKSEASRRKISFNATLIRSEKIRMGISECELYASWGYPDDQRRTVGRWGIHIQHIYGNFGPYVYTENGRVTSWQD